MSDLDADADGPTGNRGDQGRAAPARGGPDGLGRELRAAVRGDVDLSVTARALHTMDASNYRRVPDAVVAPRDADDVAAVLAVCRDRNVPVVPRGAGTSIAGQATGTGVVLDFTRHMNRVLALDPEHRTAVVQPGVVLDDLRAAAAPHGLTFGPDPSTHSRCTLGGMIGNNSCGSHSVAWGTTADNVSALSVVDGAGALRDLARGWDSAPAGLRALVDGDLALLRTGFPDLPRRISGYALDALLPERGPDLARAFCGSEGTLGVVTEAVVRLVEAPRARALAVLGYADESAAAEAAAGLLPHGPLTVEGMAADLVRGAARESGLPKGGAWLFVETGSDSPAEARARAVTIVRAAAPDTVDAVVVDDPAGQRALWRVREDASGTATRMPDGSEAWPGWEDCAVPPARLGAYLRDFRALLGEHGLRGTPYGHFGDGCIHVRIDFDLLSTEGLARFRRFSEDLADVVVAHGGSLSGEHGDGQARAELLPKMYGPGLIRLFERVKDLWDPAGLLNPGMLVRPAPLDADLRFAPLPREPVDVVFGYPQDGGDFSAAVRRCVGVAKCRTASPASPTGVMCPSFRATGEEEHSTRGRARLLHEMLAGEVVTDGWRSTEVRDALDLCLSCKGCRSDCPVGVDMATYKAEFLHHHYEGRRRPAAHYTMGRLPRWLRAVATTRTARLVNTLSRVAPLAALAKRLGGIAPERPLPRVAPRTFRQWWGSRERSGGRGGGGSGGGLGAGSRAGAGAGGWSRDGSESRDESESRVSGDSRGRSGLRAEGWSWAGADSWVRSGLWGGSRARAGAESWVRSGLRGGSRARGGAESWVRSGLRGGSRARGGGQSRGGSRSRGAEAADVVLWPDTFTEHLAPAVGQAAVAVMEDAGLRVAVPPRGVCCGLTYVSTGQLDRARAVLRATLDRMEPLLDAGTPVVVLEPSCAAALKSDLPELLGDDPRAPRLAAAIRTFAQAVEELAPQWQPPVLGRPVVGQTHCHQHAILGDAAERRLRAKAGLTGELSGGCCGLAGNFGFERGHYDVSKACAEEQLLPSVAEAEAAADGDAVILADGFSCRTQLDQLAGVRGRHLAEVLAEGLRHTGAGSEGRERGSGGG